MTDRQKLFGMSFWRVLGRDPEEAKSMLSLSISVLASYYFTGQATLLDQRVLYSGS